MTEGTARPDEPADPFGQARAVADAVLYEGYVLYPYRASDPKNRVRWQWGVLVPPGYAAAGDSERSWSQTECLVEGDRAGLTVRVRFLQVQRRRVEAAAAGGFAAVDELDVGDTTYLPWDEAVEHSVDVRAELPGLLDEPAEQPFTVEGGTDVETIHDAAGAVSGRLVRERWQLSGVARVECQRLPGPYGVLRLRARVDNRTEWTGPRVRAEALRSSLVAAHLLLHADSGRFVSLLDPPEWARPYAEECANVGTYPVLAGADGRGDLLLSSPIILYDHPLVAPESAASFMDATEIDELLSLRTLTLTEREKREARGTDTRAGALIEHVENMPPELVDRLHGAVRSLRATPRRVTAEGQGTASPDVPWWDPDADAEVSPGTDSVVVAGSRLSAGSKVLLCPGRKRADAQDMFLAGRSATVAAVLSDVDGERHLAVSLDDDPEAAEIQQAHGRYLYFAPDEVQPVEDG